jgi:hypothetical protein
MTEIAIVVSTVVVSGLIIHVAEKRWHPKHRIIWGLVPLSLSPLLTLAAVLIGKLS